jgi:hypothetical protein
LEAGMDVEAIVKKQVEGANDYFDNLSKDKKKVFEDFKKSIGWDKLSSEKQSGLLIKMNTTHIQNNVQAGDPALFSKVRDLAEIKQTLIKDLGVDPKVADKQVRTLASEKNKILGQDYKKKLDFEEYKKYGIERDGTMVHFPKECTPIMISKKMIPLPKRNAGGKHRERYMGNDCKVYEWDSQHGKFEVYSPNSKLNHFYHDGEASPINGEINSNKNDPKRDHSAGDTGIPGYDMKQLCNDHSKGKLSPEKFTANSKARAYLKCF